MVFLGEADRCSVICILGKAVGATNGLQSWVKMEKGLLRVLYLVIFGSSDALLTEFNDYDYVCGMTVLNAKLKSMNSILT